MLTGGKIGAYHLNGERRLPYTEKHLRFLATIFQLLSKQSNRAFLLKSQTKEEVFDFLRKTLPDIKTERI